MTADECEFFSCDYCCPPDYLVKAGFVCPSALPMQPGDITNKCGGSNDDLMTEEEYDAKQAAEAGTSSSIRGGRI
jgi:hypothetical protein